MSHLISSEHVTYLTSEIAATDPLAPGAKAAVLDWAKSHGAYCALEKPVKILTRDGPARIAWSAWSAIAALR